MAKAVYRRKHLTGGLLIASEGWSKNTVGSMAAGRQLGTAAVAEGLHPIHRQKTEQGWAC